MAPHHTCILSCTKTCSFCFATHAVLCGIVDSIHPNPTTATALPFEWCWIASAAVSLNLQLLGLAAATPMCHLSLSTDTHSSPKRAGGCGKKVHFAGVWGFLSQNGTPSHLHSVLHKNLLFLFRDTCSVMWE